MDPESLLAKELPIFIDGGSILDDFNGVSINGVLFNTNTIQQTIAIMVLGVIAFNLRHAKKTACLFEVLECLSGVWSKGTTIKLQNLVSCMKLLSVFLYLYFPV